MKIITPIPHNIYLAISGGVDSMMVRHFLTAGRRKIKYLFMDHGTPHSSVAREFLTNLIPDLVVGEIRSEKLPKESDEMFWRRERYAFFDQYQDMPIITCHHLDDQVENWIMGCAKGRPKLIPHSRDNYIRPFLFCKKSEIKKYVSKNSIASVNDPSNEEVSYTRNRIRHNVIPEMLKSFPGLYTTVANLVRINMDVSAI